MPIKILRASGTQRYAPCVICDLCGKRITDGSCHIMFQPDMNGGFNPMFFHRYARKRKTGFDTCKYREVLGRSGVRKDKYIGKADPLPVIAGVDFEYFLDDLWNNSTNGENG